MITKGLFWVKYMGKGEVGKPFDLASNFALLLSASMRDTFFEHLEKEV